MKHIDNDNLDNSKVEILNIQNIESINSKQPNDITKHIIRSIPRNWSSITKKKSEYQLIKEALKGNFEAERALLFEYSMKMDNINYKYYANKFTQNGSKFSMYHLGKIYYDEEDYINALLWLKKSFTVYHSSLLLGNLYQKSNDQIHALLWYAKCAFLHPATGSTYWYDGCKKLKEMVGLRELKNNILATKIIKHFDIVDQNEGCKLDGNSQYGFPLYSENQPARDKAKKEIDDSKNDIILYIGKIYFFGIDIEQDFTLAEYWLRKTVDQNEALYMLGLIRSLSLAGITDYKEAATNLFLSAKGQNKNALSLLNEIGLDYCNQNLAQLLAENINIIEFYFAKLLCDSQIKNAEKHGQIILEKQAQHGNEEAKFLLEQIKRKNKRKICNINPPGSNDDIENGVSLTTKWQSLISLVEQEFANAKN